MCLGVFILSGLGTWQLARLNWKTDLIAEVDARVAAAPVPFLVDVEPLAYTPVRLSGTFRAEAVAHVAGTHEGAPGWFVFQAFALDPRDGKTGSVIVNRGFVPFDDRADQYPAPDMALEVTGLVRTFDRPNALAKAFTAPFDMTKGSFYSRERGPLRQYLTDDAEAESVASVYVDQSGGDDLAAVPLAGTTRVEFSNRHLGYALTWYGLALGLIGVYVIKRRELA